MYTSTVDTPMHAILCFIRLDALSVTITKEFMRKFTKDTVQHILPLLLTAVSVVMLLASPAHGEVHKCTGTDGKTGFSDQPCPASQKSSPVNARAASGAARGTSESDKTPLTMDYKSRPEYKECVKLKAKFNDYFMGPIAGTTGKQAEQMRDNLARYKEICSVVDQAAERELKEASGVAVGVREVNKTPLKMDYKSRPEYPECRILKAQVDEYFMGPVVGTTGKQAEQARDNLVRYKELCSIVDQAVGREIKESREVRETPRPPEDRTVENARRCEAMQRNLAELKKLGPALAKSTDRLNPQDALARKKEIAGIEQRIPLIAEEIEKSCSKK